MNGPKIQINSYEELIDEMLNAMEEYKGVVDNLGMNSSDRKKILALPFYLTKR